jgi:NIMA (never in mitosis gene a)-related kinase
MEYANGGNLRTKLKQIHNQKVFWSDKKILTVFCQLCEAIEYMHDNYFMHRDIKPENIFLTSDDIPKLGDFGTSKMLSSTMSKAKTF